MRGRDVEVQRQGGAPAPIWLLFGAMALIEAAFQAADAGVLGPSDLRLAAYVDYAFLDVLFDNWLAGGGAGPNFHLRFVSHAFLHGGLLHIALNGVIFLALGGVLWRILGPARFAALFVVTAVAGAVTFGLMAEARGPLVGASGVIFGFFGIFKAWEWRWIRFTGAPPTRFWGTIIGLTAINVILAFGPLGAVAWQAHLGGFVAGFALGPLLAPGRRAPSPI